MNLRRLAAIVAAVVVLAGAAALAYRSVLPGLSSARREPPAAEITIATWLLRESVPKAARAQINPLGKDPAAIAAGLELFRQKCAVCHAYDGSAIKYRLRCTRKIDCCDDPVVVKKPLISRAKIPDDLVCIVDTRWTTG